MKFIFGNRFSYFDIAIIGLVANLVSKENWLAAIPIFILGVILSTSAGLYIKKRENN